ncbi:phosphatase PAP2 family protein [Microterricola viridarii]|uniref:Undecaprenyl-diphosphatase n=1 Tax=Microterricola viridarii TaxID=412690 RepID=A0A1H1XT29_9MICO|nr:phosphatase PAP2 family protein [Microterricola viridarii]SDT12019.1 undecaprenyl-diphosphatase [Microterricola viridarii]
MAISSDTTPLAEAPPRRAQLPARLAVAWGLISLAVFAVLFASVLASANSPWFVAMDQWWHDVVLAPRNDAFTAFNVVVDHTTGGPIGSIFTILIPLVALLVLRRWWAALYFFVATMLASTLAQVVKAVVSRERPNDPLVTVDFGSFPSGHLTGFTLFVVVLCLLINRRWAWITALVLVIVTVLNRTYLSAHWLSDTFAGIALGAAVALLLWPLFAQAIARQPKPRQPRARAGERAA